MADFVAVIRKAVDNLSENTPENRAKVYDKARAAIRRQLEAINPPPSDEVMASQLDKLGAAIDEVESEHAEALPADLDETDALMAELESMVEKSPVVAEPARAAPPPAPVAPEPVASAPVAPRMEQQPAAAVYEPQAAVPQAAPIDEREPEAVMASGDLSGPAHDDAFGLGPDANATGAARKPALGSGGVLALVVALALAGVGYAGWAYKDTFMAMLGTSQSETAEPAAPSETAPETAAVTPETSTPETPAAPETTPSEPAPAEPVTSDAAPSEPADPAEGEKFTQRLNADGTETDAGPAPGPATDAPVEGRSVAGLTDTTPADEAIAEESTAEAEVTTEEAAVPQSDPLGVSQKMILYEERLGQQSLEVKPGTVVWTLVSEPSSEGPDSPVIRGEINNPDTGLSALLTIKKNNDPSLPASHLVEIVFAVPEGFSGGSIDQLQRISFKQTEADQGSPLIAVPAKITQDFYMVALNDLPEAAEANTGLMRQRSWIDIPVVYANGRQALITLEKGTTGTEVFNQALDAWARGSQ
ncbi:hypothetical protein HPDFL43_15162 [Hoeflea phototrophica DFL-43]|jgi:hypothetical protein|uniref:Uncharacterized protein n=1 Tax=Hoeflea phototrophica (strain DSM 17068 / NCIMB 14078 / DFL-43) TaxID=411684 RepID=A9D367_HOEPD|nr:hypothetical protein [Hoeflea phototrophica]EDQ34348.1 hypothetical protein HPDFL43_15162 [Hoeflea phototrophica DFL-43]